MKKLESAAKEVEKFKDASKKAEAAGVSAASKTNTAKNDKVASDTAKEVKSDGGANGKGKTTDSGCDTNENFIDKICNWLKSEEAKEIGISILIGVAAVATAVVVGPALATFVAGLAGITATTSLTIAMAGLVGGTTYGYLNSVSDGEPLYQNINEGLQTGAIYSLGMLAMYNIYLGLSQIMALLNGVTPEKAADGFEDFHELMNRITLEDGTTSESGIDTSWYKPDGSINYPPNNGAVPGTEVNMTLKPRDTLGRYGNIGEKSNFVTQTGVDASKLALPPNTNPAIYQEFEVIKEIPGTIQAEIAPWGGSAGGGLQYELPKPILQLIKEGYIVPK